MSSPIPRQPHTFLAISLPKENEKGPIVMEQLLSLIHGLNTKVSLEIWSHNQRTQFAVFCPKLHQNFIVHQLQSYYPGIDVQEKPDPAETLATATTVCLQLRTIPIFPIRRYSQTADNINRTWTDPYLGVLPAIHKTEDREIRGVQIIFTPAPITWRKTGLETLHIYTRMSGLFIFKRWPWLNKKFFQIVYASTWLRFLIFCLLAKPGRPGNPDKIDHRKHVLESISEAAYSKLAQIGFAVTIRLIVTRKEGSQSQALQELASSFAQFNIPELNGFVVRPGHSQKSLGEIKSRTIVSPMMLSLEELAGILALPTSEVNVPGLARMPFKILPCTEETTSGVVIGTPIPQRAGRFIRIPYQHLNKHILIIGRTGSGKSTLMRRLIAQLITDRQGVALFDPHGDLLETVLTLVPEPRVADTILLDPTDQDYPVSFNVLHGSGRRDQVVSSIIDVFQKLFTSSWGPRTEYILTQAVAALSYLPNASLLGIPRLLLNAQYRKTCLKYLTDPVLTEFWETEYKTMPARLRMEAITPLLNKVNRFLMVPMMRNILGQQENRLHLRKIIDSQAVLLINLAKGVLGEENSRLLGNFLLAHLQIAALSRADTAREKRPQFTVFIDELQHFAQADSGHLTTLLAESRKYHINLVVACQHLSQLRDLAPSILGNISTFIVFNVGAEDARKVAEYLGEVTPDDLISLPTHYAYLRVFRNNTPQVVSFRNVLDAENPDVVPAPFEDQIRARCRTTYARPRQKVEKEISAFFQTELPIP